MYFSGRAFWLGSLLAPSLVISDPISAGDPELTSVLVTQAEFPVFVSSAPGDFERLFIVEKDGRILVLKDGVVLGDPFLDLTTIVDGDTELLTGMLCLAFHPEYQTNGYFYVTYTREGDGNSVIARYQATGDPNVADPDSAYPIMTVPLPELSHKVDWLAFNAHDCCFYVAIGDGGGGDNTAAQDLDSLLGKILRIDVDDDEFPDDPERNYAIPPDNPFVAMAGADEIWAYGLRQPWRCSFDSETGDLYIADVGRADWEEVNFQLASSRGGENYGWNCREGAQCTKQLSCDCTDPELVDPLWVYPHPAGAAAIVGSSVYRGCEIPDMNGVVIVADHKGQIWWLEHDGQQVTRLREIQDEIAPGGGEAIDQPTSLGHDAFGELYICDSTAGNGEIYKIVPVEFQGPDCNGNGVADACEIRSGDAQDVNGNGIPDECECLADLDGDGTVGTPDLLIVLGAWGPNPGHPADFDGDGNVGTSDLIELLGNWGPCPK